MDNYVCHVFQVYQVFRVCKRIDAEPNLSAAKISGETLVDLVDGPLGRSPLKVEEVPT